MPVQVESSTKRGLDYLVMVSPWGDSRDNNCECPGYMMKGACRHQVEAMKKVCRWTELGNEPQSEQEYEKRVCPRCGGPTKWELEIENE